LYLPAIETMNASTYTVLIVEDCLADREFYRRALRKDTNYVYRFLEAESVAQGLSLCSSTSIDAVLLDYLLPDADGLEFLTTLAVQCNGNRPPVVMMTGQGSESIAVQAMKLGVQDYLVKGDLTPELLRLVVRNAIDNSRLKSKLQVANQRTIEIWESMADAYITVDRDWRIIYANQAATQAICHLTNLAPAEFLGRSHWDLFPALLGGDAEREYRRALDERVTLHLEIWLDPTGGWFETHLYPAAEGLGIYFRDITDRKREEAVLQQAEATIRQQLEEIETIYRNAPIGMCFVDTDLRYIRINPLLAQINGASISAHLGHTFREVLPELADRVEPLYRQVIESGEAIIDLEVSGTNQAQPGVERHWLTSFYPQIDAAGRVIGVNNVVYEITDRKRLELERLEAQQERDRFFNLSIDLLGVANFDGYFTRLNPALEQVLGFTNAELMAQPFIDFVHPDDRASTVAAAQRLSAGEVLVSFENRYRCQDGSYRWLLWSATPDLEQQLVYASGRDITDRKRAERDLREAQERLRAGIEVAGVGLARFDYTTNLVSLSPEAASLYGFSADTTFVTREQIHDTFHPDERTALEATISQVINPDGTGWFAQDHRVVWPSGEVRCLSVRKQVFFDRSGAVARPSYAILAAIDITERNQTLADLEARNQELDSFVYIVSHDLKAPLRAVANLSEWIEEDLAGSLTDANQEQMTLLRSRIYRMQSTIDGLLDYARSGRTDCINEPVDVAQLLAETIESISPPPTFTISIAQNLPTLNTKRLLLSQVFTNLIGNGIKHHDRLDGSIQISIAERGNFYEFEIADDGPGIALEHQERMFKIFQAVNPQNRSDSTGIGLAIVKKIIEAEGGTIRLESLVGKGTTFYFTWPMV
jgi:PAS domain S-box-containing protein